MKIEIPLDRHNTYFIITNDILLEVDRITYEDYSGICVYYFLGDLVVVYNGQDWMDEKKVYSNKAYFITGTDGIYRITVKDKK